MIEVHGPYEDSSGVTHANPVFFIFYARKDSGATEVLEFAGGVEGHKERSWSGATINYHVAFWTSEGAKVRGAKPLMLNEEGFTFDIVHEDGSSLVEKCERHFTRHHTEDYKIK